MNADRTRKTVLLVLVASITALFVVMIRSFLTTLLMAAITAALLFLCTEGFSPRSRVDAAPPRPRPPPCWCWRYCCLC